VNFTIAIYICREYLRQKHNLSPPDVIKLIEKHILPVIPVLFPMDLLLWESYFRVRSQRSWSILKKEFWQWREMEDSDELPGAGNS